MTGGAPRDFTVRRGELLLILTPKEEISARLARLLVGVERPGKGTLLLFGDDTAILTEKELCLLRQRVGLLQRLGGLISNLKVWENLTLPLYYHRQMEPAETEALGLALLQRVGYAGRYMELPGHLSLFQKKQIGLARAMIMDPELMIYESPEQGLNQQEREFLFRLIREFHRERPGRASMVLSCQPDTLAEFPGALSLEFIEEQPT